MKHIFYIVRFLRFLLNKDASFWKSNEDIVDALHQAQMSLFMERIGNPAKYQVGHPVPPVTYQVTKKIAADLQPFLKEASVPVSEGAIILPADFVYPTSLRVSRAGSKIEVVDDNKITDRLRSVVKPVDTEYPVAEYSSTGYHVYPETLPTVFIKYLSLPQRPFYATDLVGDNEVYNDEYSVDIQFPPITHNEIINRALAHLGLNVKDNMAENYATYQKQQGS